MNILTLKKKNKITASSIEAWASKATHLGFSRLGFFFFVHWNPTIILSLLMRKRLKNK